jgi:integrase
VPKPNRKRLTEDNVLHLPIKRQQYMVWDEGKGPDAVKGLGILISPSGTRSYRCMYYFPGSSKAYSMHLGRVGEMSLADARKQTLHARGKAREGIDPKGDDVRNSADFKSAIEDYVKREQIGRRENVTAREVERILLKACAAWHHRPVATIRADEIDKLLTSIRDDNGTPYMANKVHGLLFTFFKWCAKAHVEKIKTSPMVGLDKPFLKEQPRQRVFTDQELKLIWSAADELGGTEGRFLKLLLLTGKRKGALSAMKWEEVDDQWYWTPPASEHRNKRLHPIPLPALAQRVLGARQPRGYVFPGTVDNTHYSDDDNSLHRKVKRRVDLADFFPHALRHTAETKMAVLGIPPHIRDLLFDHRSARGAGAGYDHYSYGKEMRQAMELWADHVEALIQPKGARVLR